MSDVEYDLEPQAKVRGMKRARTDVREDVGGEEALVEYHGSTLTTGSSAAAGGAPQGPPSRPVAITKHGLRQYVESSQGLRLYLQNCVASLDLKCNPDLAHVATHARNAEYNPQRFAAVIMRLRDPRATGLIFHSGKMVITGTKNEEDSLLAARTVAKILQKLGTSCAVAGFKIQNIVATGDCGFPIRLEGLAHEQCKFSSYEPELFPGLIYRMEVPKVVLLVFVSGKVVITGAKSRSALLECVIHPRA